MTAFRQRILVMVAGITTTCAVAQPSLEAPASDAETQILEQLRVIEAQDGVHSTEAIGPMTALALIYQEKGDHDLALAMIEQARGVIRANYGLYSFDEVPLLQMAIRSWEARGNAAVAWDLEHELLDFLAAHYPHDLRTYPVYREVAGKRADVLEDYRGGGFPPQIVLGCYYGEGCLAGSRGMVIARLRNEVTRLYTVALNKLLQSAPSSAELRSFLAEVLPVVYRNNAFLDVARVFRRLLEHESTTPVSPRSRADTLIQVADWNATELNRERSIMVRLVRLPNVMLEQYRQAYEELKSAGIDQASIDAIFAPPIPVVLPTFVPSSLSPEETSGSTGYVDVAFDVTRYGYAENIEVLDATKGLLRRTKNDLVTLIEESTFRPRTTNGEFAERSRVEVRYYLSGDSL